MEQSKVLPGSLMLLLLVLNCLTTGPVYAACTSPTGNEGDIVYNSSYHTYQFCNGLAWMPYAGGSNCTALSGSYSPTTPTGVGYFVLSKSTFASTAYANNAAWDAACLTELTTNTAWQGYSTANSNSQLTAANVHAFICYDSTGCNNFIPLATYYFANANDGTAGGASFTTDGNGVGPNTSTAWSGSLMFAVKG